MQDPLNFGAVSKCRAGCALGRCHAALGQHELSQAAFEAALELAQTGRYVLQEALVVRALALAGRVSGSTGAAGRHWDVNEGRARLAEVAARMHGEERGPIEALLRLP